MARQSCACRPMWAHVGHDLERPHIHRYRAGTDRNAERPRMRDERNVLWVVTRLAQHTPAPFRCHHPAAVSPDRFLISRRSSINLAEQKLEETRRTWLVGAAQGRAGGKVQSIIPTRWFGSRVLPRRGDRSAKTSNCAFPSEWRILKARRCTQTCLTHQMNRQCAGADICPTSSGSSERSNETDNKATIPKPT